MASVSTLESPTDTPEIEHPIDPKADSKGSKLPKPGAKTLQPDAFYAYTAKLTEADWAHAIIYVFRQWPRIIRDPKHIDKLSGPVTEDYLLRSHGSGKYWIMLNDTDADRTICQSYPDIDNPSFAPKIDLRELDVANDKNRTFVDHLKRAGKLSMDGEVLNGKSETSDSSLAQALRDVALKAMENKNGGQQGTQDLAYQKSLGMIADASSESLKVVMDRLKTEGKGSDLAVIMPLLIELVKAKSAPPPPPVIDNTVITILTQMLNAAEKRAEAADARANEERKDARAQAQRQHEKELALLAQRGDPLDMVDKVLGLKAKLGGDEPDPRNWKEKLVDQGFEALPQILTAVQSIGYRRQANQPGAPQNPSVAPQNSPTPNNNSAEVIEMPTTIHSDPEIVWLYPILLAKGPDIVQFFKNDPASGPLVADLVRTMAGATTYERMARMGVDKILETIKLIPQMEQDLAAAGTPEMVREFIEGFIDPDGDDDDDEQPVIPEGVVAPKKPRAKKVVQ